jgi:hypothetical protein
MVNGLGETIFYTVLVSYFYKYRMANECTFSAIRPTSTREMKEGTCHLYRIPTTKHVIIFHHKSKPIIAATTATAPIAHEPCVALADPVLLALVVAAAAEEAVVAAPVDAGAVLAPVVPI